MGTTLLAIADFWMPLQSLASRLMPARRASHHGGLGLEDASDAASGLRYVAVRPTCTVRTATPVATAPARPLRVVRLVDAQAQGRSRGGNRVVISGRMADVCAELDRLAALETAETTGHSPVSTQLH